MVSNKTTNEINHKDVQEEVRFLSYARFIKPAVQPIALMAKKSIHFMRPSAYASEVGESTKAVVPGYVYKLLYGISGAYVLTDILIKVHDLSENKQVIDHYGAGHQKDPILAKKFGDSLLWHFFASFALPGLAVHQTVKFASMANKFITSPKIPQSLIRAYPPLLGLAMIPFIIHPIDHAVDYALDNTVRTLYSPETRKFLTIDEDLHHD